MNLSWIGLVGLHTLGVMSPGPDFAVVLKNSLTFSRREGLMTTLGILLSNLLHVLLAFAGISWLFKVYPRAESYLCLAGGIYLIYLGLKTGREFLTARIWMPANSQAPPRFRAVEKRAKASFSEGFFTSLLNLKALLYFSAILSGASGLGIRGLNLFVFTALLVAIGGGWFTFVAWISGSPLIQQKIQPGLKWINLGCSFLFVILGLRLILEL